MTMLEPEEFWAIYGRGARLFDATGRELRMVMACNLETGEVIRWNQRYAWNPLAWLVGLLPRPIPLAEREPGPGDLGGFDSNSCWWGHWQDDHWLWIWDCEPVRGETHWLPASVEVLPARCCPPEAK